MGWPATADMPIPYGATPAPQADAPMLVVEMLVLDAARITEPMH